MLSYCELTGRDERTYRDQIKKFIPVLDRTYLKDWYEKQAKEMEKQRMKAAAKAQQPRR